jgi:hypothetical protein
MRETGVKRDRRGERNRGGGKKIYVIRGERYE